MKKLNNRGFILIETVIVSVLVLAIFTMVYQNCVPLINEYNHRIRYDDADSIYIISVYREMVLEDTSYNSFINTVKTNGYMNISDCNLFVPAKRGLCNALKDFLGVDGDNYLYLSTWDVAKLSRDPNLPRGYLDYVKYLQTEAQETKTDYRLILSRTHTYMDAKVDEDGNVVQKEKHVNHYANIGF